MKKAQWLRHTVQASVFCGLLLVPVLAWHQHRSMDDGGARSGETQPVPIVGNTWAVRIGPVPLMDPLGAVESTAARRIVWPGVLKAVALPILFTLLLGRVFCSWICPAGFLFELNQFLRNGLVRLGFSPGDAANLPRHVGYQVLAVGVVVTAVAGMPVLSHFYPPAILARETHRAVAGGLEGLAVPVSGAVLFLLLLLMVELVFSRRLWCRYVCPGGALYSLLGRRRWVRVRFVPSACTYCMDCIKVCPMGLDPVNNRMGAACDNCLACVSACNDQALDLGLSTRDQPVARKPE